MLRFALEYDLGIHLQKKCFMKCEIADFQRADSLVEILEKQKLFINPNLGPEHIAALSGVETGHLERSVKNHLGLSLRELTDMYKVQFAAELHKKGVAYKDLYKYSGFTTFDSFERAVNYIVY
jgi:methylphosphotriester-DNA--protein-cysteine methyltransferase